MRKIWKWLNGRMLNNYYKVVIPIINQGHFKFTEGKKASYKYKGNAYILIEKESKCIAFTTLLLDNGDIWGADDGKYGNDYVIKTYYPNLFNIRKKAFNYSLSSGRNKNSSKLRISNEKFNELILENKLTIKSVDGFITGSNSSGGLKKPSADPIRILYEGEDLISNMFDNNIKTNVKTWKIFSLLSNLTCVNNNSSFPDEVTIDYLNKVEEKDISYLFELDWEVVPYGLKDDETLYVDFKKAFGSQNIENFIDPINDSELLVLSEKNWREANHIQYIMNIINNGNKKFVSKQLRGNWRRVIDSSIKKYKFEKDFVNGFSSYDRAHILENKKGVSFLLSESNGKYEKEELLEDLFCEDNFILLDKNIHSYWDDEKIFISDDGKIKNISLDEQEFEKIIASSNDITSIYPNILSYKRSYLLNKRNKQKGL